MVSYQASSSSNKNHSIRMSYGQNIVMEPQNRTGKLPEHSSTLNAFLSLKGPEFGLTYFKEICSPMILVYP